MDTVKKLLPKIFLFLLCLVPINWFINKGGILINGVDTNFPLEPLVWFQRRIYVWNPIANGGTDFSSSTAGLFFHSIQVLPYLFKLPLQYVQIFSLVFWQTLIIVGSLLLSKKLFERKTIVQLLFVVFYSFNIYLFNTWENIKVANLALVSAIPFELTVLILLRQNSISKTKALFFSALIGIVLSGAGINPAYFVCFFLIIFIFVLADLINHSRVNDIRKRLQEFIMSSAVIVLINLFWIIPTFYFVSHNISSSGSIDKLGFNNWVQGLSENTSLLNVFRLQGLWDWYSVDSITGTPLFIPYALNYLNKFTFLGFSFLVPLLAVLSFIFRCKEKSYLYTAFGLMLLLGVFLGSGTHPPTGYFFSFLGNHVPFFTLFRSPWYIFTPLVTLSVAGLVALFFYSLLTKEAIRSSRLSMITEVIVLVMILGNLLYSYPQISGKIFRTGRIDSFYVKFPQYVFDSQKWLLTHQEGRIISYPDDEIEQYKWGYRGIESILGLFSNKEALSSPLNNTDANINVIVRDYYNYLKKGEIDSVRTIGTILNINYIFQKRDQDSLTLGIPFSDYFPEFQDFGNWRFYKSSDESDHKIYSAGKIYLSDMNNKTSKLLSVIGGRDILLNNKDTMLQQIPILLSSVSNIVLTTNSQKEEYDKFTNAPSNLKNRLFNRNLSTVDFSFNVSALGNYQPALERYKIEDFGLSTNGFQDAEIDGVAVRLELEKVDSSYVYFKKIPLDSGKHQITLKLQNKNLISDFIKDGPANFTVEDNSGTKILNIFNKGGIDSGARFNVSQFDPLSLYLINLKFQQIYGNNADVLIGQSKSGDILVKTQNERLPNYPDWNAASFYYEPVKTDSKMFITLTSPFTKDPLGTKILYSNPEAIKVFSNDLILINETQNNYTNPTVQFSKKSPVEYQGWVTNVSSPFFLVFLENYSPEWELQFDEQNSKLAAVHLSANYYANGWYIKNPPPDFRFKIYYKPQNYFYLGALLSGLLFVGLLTGLLLRLRYRKK